ncbi:MAG TPA: CHAT domain-containing tetratricopeptide repeat protein [Tenuifilaceae bacterium]|nr:CHAT domain-containing tetratricopeptide repeat protein [Tenuifilaceae bacterium]
MRSIVPTMFILFLALIAHARISSVWLNQNNPDSLAKVLNNKGVDFAVAGNFDSAAVYFRKSLKIRESIPNYPKQKLANGYLNLANIKLDLSFPDSAFLYYSKAEKEINEMPEQPTSLLGVVYYEMGNCLRYLQDFEGATLYIKKGISLLETDSITNLSRLVLAYNKLSNVYFYSGKINEAISAAESAFSMCSNDSPYFFQTTTGLGNCYLKQGKLLQAAHYFELASEYFRKYGKVNASDLIGLYNSLSLTYWKLGFSSKAELYFTRGDSLSNRVPFSPHSSMLLRNYGRFLISSNRNIEAETQFFNSLRKNSYLFDSINPLKRKISDFSKPIVAAQSFEGLGDLYSRRFNNTGNADYAKKSFNFYLKSIEILSVANREAVDEADKLLFSENFHVTYQKAIKSAVSCAESDKKFIELAFGLSGRFKASVLVNELTRVNELKFTNVPGNLMKKEADLEASIGSLKELLFETVRKEGRSSRKVKSIENRLFLIQKDYRNLLLEIENEYPDYFSLKFDTASYSISEVQHLLKPTQLLVDYVIVDSMLISFAITKTDFSLRSIPVDSTFFFNVETFLNEIKPVSFDDVKVSNVKIFADASWELYKQLILPFDSLLQDRELIVVPHLHLTSIPFSALITSKVNNPAGYYNLPFLVITTPVSYYPSTKLFYTTNRSKRSMRLSLISFSPVYSSPDDSLYSLPYRQNLVNLPGAEKESRGIVEIFNGKLFEGDNATESNFIDKASSFDIIHLAMHALLNHENPLYSKLVFSNEADTLEDGLLNLYEVYGLNLNCKLAILSACSSGDGNLVKGEGLISLARSFQYAGCPALVATRWRVDDFSGSQIMVDFAKNLKRGMSKSQALQQAQKDFLLHSDPLRSHPHFWSSYQIIGNPDPLTFSYVTKLLFWGIPLLSLMLVLFLLYRKFR